MLKSKIHWTFNLRPKRPEYFARIISFNAEWISGYWLPKLPKSNKKNIRSVYNILSVIVAQKYSEKICIVQIYPNNLTLQDKNQLLLIIKH